MAESSSSTKAKIPIFLKIWLDVWGRLPRMTIRLGSDGSRLDFSVTLATSLILGCLYGIVQQVVLIRWLGYPEGLKATQETAGSLVAIVHSTTTCTVLIHLFWTQTYRRPASSKFQESPDWWQDACHYALQFCTGYMIYDASIILWIAKGRPSPGDAMFLGHHVATILYMTSTRILGAGHVSAMTCMLIGEITNPFHNSFYIARNALSLDCCNGVWVHNFHYVNTFLFSLTYCIFRALIGPAFVLHITYDSIVHGRKNAPIWVLIVWNFLIWGVLLGSIPWVIDCWNMLTQYFPQEHTQSSTSLPSEL